MSSQPVWVTGSTIQYRCTASTVQLYYQYCTASLVTGSEQTGWQVTVTGRAESLGFTASSQL